MKSKICFGLLLFLMSTGAAFSQGAADRVSTQIDTSRAQTESRYSKVGNPPQTETIRTSPTVKLVPDNSGAGQSGPGLVADRARPKMKRVVVPGKTITVTKPARQSVNPY